MIVVERPWKLFSQTTIFGSLIFFIANAPAARRLDRRLDRLGSRVHGKHDVEAAQLGQLFAEERQLVVPECP